MLAKQNTKRAPSLLFRNLVRRTAQIQLVVVIVVVLLLPGNANAQGLLNDRTALDSLKKGLYCLYNFEFEKASTIESSIQRKYPNEPVLYLYNALFLYWKYYPVKADTDHGNQFEGHLLKAIEASKHLLKDYPDNQLVVFFDMLPRLMLLQFYADNGQGYKSIPYLRRLYESLIKGFNYCKTTPEFYFPTGLYNYYIEAYPEANPFYKPFVIFFPGGDKALGLKQLYKCWKNSPFIGVEALTFLTYIQINFETNYSNGIKYGKELSESYPNNPLFTLYHEQLLLLSKHYSDAENLAQKYRETHQTSDFFTNAFKVYDGIIAEQYHHNSKLASKEYESAIPALVQFNNYGDRYRAYASFGLSRIAKKKGNANEADSYRSTALKLAQYPQVNFDQ